MVLIRLKQATLAGTMAIVLALAGCQGTDDLLSLRENAPLPKDALDIMRAKGMTPSSPIMIRIFKQEATLEVWKQQDTGRYAMVKSYPICKWSGEKGPKFKEGDRQAPEGFYFVGRPQMNPKSDYHLSFNLGFPNSYDRSHGRTGTHLMVHGDCSSAGCYAMTDQGISEIYAFARDALGSGRQEKFQVQAFPFRMTAENMALHADDQNFEYWTMLKQGYDHFELTKQPPKVDVCEKRYVFNMQSEAAFSASAQCPPMAMPENLALAYQRQQTDYAKAFQQALETLNGKKATIEPIIEPVVGPTSAPTTRPIETEPTKEVAEVIGDPAAFPAPPSAVSP